ncbi:hypothetical protein NPIL_27121 [Nephila pilipes]|uniref:Uncharacterized protein n=1 Tax=Nephila pilipes TaxID=299642 RepID=A0A8X6UJ47_NEPPI|nr:hypothetical protein NPIL_27121 [Nephila pilipes]
MAQLADASMQDSQRYRFFLVVIRRNRRAVSTCYPPAASLTELEIALMKEWSLLASVIVDNLIENMNNPAFKIRWVT